MAAVRVVSEIAGTVWKLEAAVGAPVTRDSCVAILESMKMEIPVSAPCDGTLKEWRVVEGDAVSEGQLLAIIEP